MPPVIYGDGLAAVLVVGFWLFCLFDVIITDESQVRNLSKGWWVLVVGLLSVVGSIMWLVAGRPQGPAAGERSSRADRGRWSTAPQGVARAAPGAPDRRLAPDDDADFLDRARNQNQQDNDLLRRWEEDLRRREEELRRQEPPAAGDPPPGG